MTQQEFLNNSKALNKRQEQIISAKRELRQIYINANKKADIGQLVKTHKGNGIVHSIDILNDGTIIYDVHKIKSNGLISLVSLIRTHNVQSLHDPQSL
jgi:hypothetical protein